MIIDAHQHFWAYSADEYDWIDESMAVLRRDFLPEHLEPILSEAGVGATVAVQARQSLVETDWLLALASRHAFIRGVVGWVPLREKGERVIEDLDRYQAHAAFKGVRHVLQGEPDAYMADAAFNAGVATLAGRGLAYDLLVFARQLPAALAFVDRHPQLRIMLDHIAKPVVAGAPPAAWVASIRELALRPQVMCKFSGVVTEVPGREWTPALLRPYFDVVLEAFGARRVVFGSDWPVCLVASDYLGWREFVTACTESLSPDERAAIFGGNAASFYRLSV